MNYTLLHSNLTGRVYTSVSDGEEIEVELYSSRPGELEVLDTLAHDICDFWAAHHLLPAVIEHDEVEGLCAWAQVARGGSPGATTEEQHTARVFLGDSSRHLCITWHWDRYPPALRPLLAYASEWMRSGRLELES